MKARYTRLDERPLQRHHWVGPHLLEEKANEGTRRVTGASWAFSGSWSSGAHLSVPYRKTGKPRRMASEGQDSRLS